MAISQSAQKQSAQKQTGRVVRCAIEIGIGIGIGLTVDAREVAGTVAAVLTRASPALTARLCAALNVAAQQVSCWNGGRSVLKLTRSVLHLTRWLLGSRTCGADLAAYRTYLVNHEVGHGLVHLHRGCPAPRKPAPVMVQQTRSLEGCTPWLNPGPSCRPAPQGQAIGIRTTRRTPTSPSGSR